MNIGFIGLGQMGAPMAANLAKHHAVMVYDNNKDRLKSSVENGFQSIKIDDGFEQLDIIILSLPGTTSVKDVLFNDDCGIVNTLKQNALLIDTSTIDYSETLAIAAKLEQAGFQFIDAPVTGMRARAEDATLTMMCGGNKETIEKVHPILATMANTILHMGEHGAGQLAKLMNQLLFDVNAAAIAEILPIAVKLGLDAKQIGEVVNTGSGRSFASEFFIPRILAGQFNQGYPMAAAYKDLVSAATVTAEQQFPTPVLSAATATYQQALHAGHGDKDKGAMILVYEKLLNVKFRQ